MAVVKRIKRRGATTTIEANAEVLFMPGGSVNRWTGRLGRNITAATRSAAPSNSRPRWSHYGKPLRNTIMGTTPEFVGNGRDTQRVYVAVGAKAPHAYFVDQGTGVFAGNGPYEAKILPPWQREGASLYERTWRPGGPGTRRVAPVMIKGQPGQHFFDRGLRDGFRSSRMGTVKVSGQGTPKIAKALASTPPSLERFVGSGNTQANPAFVGQLKEWRKWRDEAWSEGRGLGRGGGIGSRAHEQAVAASRNKPRGAKTTAPKAPKAPKAPTNGGTSRATDRKNFIAAMVKKYKKVDMHSIEYRDGYWYMTVWGIDAKGRESWIETRAKAKS